jgi:hypothetical protein
VIPEETRNRIDLAGEAAPQEGVQIAVALIEQIKDWGQGVYIMPAFSRYDLAAEMVDAVR